MGWHDVRLWGRNRVGVVRQFLVLEVIKGLLNQSGYPSRLAGAIHDATPYQKRDEKDTGRFEQGPSVGFPVFSHCDANSARDIEVGTNRGDPCRSPAE